MADEIKLEGKLKENISQAYQSVKGTTFYVARLLNTEDESEEEEAALFFWDDGRFDPETMEKIQNLVADDHVVIYAEKRTNPRDGRIIYHVKRLGEEGFEVFS